MCDEQRAACPHSSPGEIRERRGLAYFVHTSVDTYQDCGYIATQAGVEHNKVNGVMQYDDWASLRRHSRFRPRYLELYW